VVLGSANADRVVRVRHLPAPGETLTATGARTHPGGKGANQAVAAARAGARVHLHACLGDDANGQLLRGWLGGEGIDLANVRTVDAPTGNAVVTVDASGENTVVVVPGANALVSATLLDLGPGDVLVLQQEVPESTVHAALVHARQRGATSLLSCAPFRPVAAATLAMATGVLVNAGELAALGGQVAREPDQWLVVTQGAQGADLLDGSGAQRVNSPAVRAVDTTGAGDCLAGVLAAGLARRLPIAEALAHAVRAAALSVTAAGAGPSMPHWDGQGWLEAQDRGRLSG
jgi:ribokinase